MRMYCDSHPCCSLLLMQLWVCETLTPFRISLTCESCTLMIRFQFWTHWQCTIIVGMCRSDVRVDRYSVYGVRMVRSGSLFVAEGCQSKSQSTFGNIKVKSLPSRSSSCQKLGSVALTRRSINHPFPHLLDLHPTSS